MFNYKYLSQKHIKGLSKYKYSAIDTSPLSNYVMHPAWNTLVRLIPKCIAPNLITFSGFLCMVVVVALTYWFDYDFHAVDRTAEYSRFLEGGTEEYGIPNWCFTLCGILVFLAYNLDGIDGKQARRLGMSGPLGELFDHGLDSYIVFLIPFSIISIFGRDVEYSLSCFRGFLVVVSVVLNYYVSHFEKYNTGTLYLPWGYDVSMWVCSLLFIVAGVYGPSIYKIYVFGSFTFAMVFEILIHSVGVATAPVVLYNIYLSYKNRTGRMLPFFEAIRPLSSIVVTTATAVYWALHSKNDILEYDPRSFIFLYGTMFSHIASRLIIAEMTYQRCDLITWTYWPLLAGVITSINLPQLEVPILYTLMLTALLIHVHYGVCVVRKICSHLKISCFTVPKDKRK